MKPLSEMHKIWGRQVYCETWWGWVVSMLRCNVWLRLSPPRLPEFPSAPTSPPR